MAYPRYLRERAREMRVKEKLWLIEISERLALPKTTVYYWTRDLPLGRPRRENGHPGNVAMQRKYRLIREEAYRKGEQEFKDLALAEPEFRDFSASTSRRDTSGIETAFRSATQTQRSSYLLPTGSVGSVIAAWTAASSSTRTKSRTPLSPSGRTASRSIQDASDYKESRTAAGSPIGNGAVSTA
jgi:hypothetical protein